MSSRILLALVVACVSLGAIPSAAEDGVTLRIDLQADEEYRRCMGLLAAGQELPGRACLHRVVERAPDSTAALRARAALDAIKTRRVIESTTGGPPKYWPFPPGRLNLALAAGGMGIWTGTAAAVALASIPNIVPLLLIATGGGVAIAFGGTLAVAAFFAGQFLEVKPGTSRLIGSGFGWGTAYGLAMSPWLFWAAGAKWDAGYLLPERDSWERVLPFALGLTVATGYLGVGLSAGLALFLDMSEGQVSTMNTGGATGFAMGLTMAPMFAVVGMGAPGWLGLGTLLTTTLGLAGGLAMAHLVDFDLWEVGVIDLSTLVALGVVGGGSIAASYVLAGGSPVINAFLGGVTAVGVGAALIASTAAVGWFRLRRGKRVSRIGFIRLDEMYGQPNDIFSGEEAQLAPRHLPVLEPTRRAMSFVDKDGQSVMMSPLFSTRFDLSL